MYKETKLVRSGIVGSGNGIRKNQALVRIFEQKFGSDMKITANTEEAACGAALFALVAQGTFKTPEQVQKLIKYVKI